MKHLKITLALFSVVLTTIIAFPAHAETEYFNCRASSGIESERGFVSAALPVDEDDYSKDKAESSFEAHVEDEYGVEVSAYCPSHSHDRSVIREWIREDKNFIRNDLEFRLTTISESEWDYDSMKTVVPAHAEKNNIVDTVGSIITGALSAHAEIISAQKYFSCYAVTAVIERVGPDLVGGARRYVSAALPVDEDDYSRYKAGSSFKAHVEDKYGGEVDDAYDCSYAPVDRSSALKTIRRIKDNSEVPTTTISKSEWNYDS